MSKEDRNFIITEYKLKPAEAVYKREGLAAWLPTTEKKPMTKKLGKVKSQFNKYLKIEGAYSPRQKIPVSHNMPPGVYSLLSDDNGNVYFSPVNTLSDELLDLPETVSDMVLKEAVKFWEGSTKEKFKEYGLVYKRGVLLYGKQGTGKTCTIIRLMEKVVNDCGIVLYNPNVGMLGKAIKQAREVEPDLDFLIVFEDFEGFCKSPEFLSMLDGEMQLENIFYVATTNHIEQVPDKVKNRPSRFATVVEVGPPGVEARALYIRHKIKGITAEEAVEWVTLSEGMVIDQIKDLIVTVKCFEVPLKEAVAKIAGMETMSDLKRENETNKLQNNLIASISRAFEKVIEAPKFFANEAKEMQN